jgi:hypothetical protein
MFADVTEEINQFQRHEPLALLGSAVWARRNKNFDNCPQASRFSRRLWIAA